MNKFGFRQLILPLLPMWLLAWGLGVITLSSVLGLAMVSGWFITMAGVVGVGSGFNYLVPSALIRTFAIGRTLGRYGELLVSHDTIFELLKNLRVTFFYRFSALSGHQQQRIGSSVAQHRLVKDIDTLDEWALRVVSPWLMALFAVCVLGLVVAFWVAIPLGISLLLLTALAVVCYPDLATKIEAIDEKRQVSLLDHLPVLPQLVLWGQWQQVSDKLLAMDDKVGGLLLKADARKRWGLLVLHWWIGGLVLLVLVIGGRDLHSGTQVAYLLAVVLGLLVVGELLAAAMDPLALGRALVAKKRLQTLLSGQPKKTAIQLPAHYQLALHHVAAKHPTAVVGVMGVNACIRIGRPLVIYGVSGGGKSTLLAVLAGLLRPHEGRAFLLAGDESLDTYEVDWQGQLGFLGQTVDIFNQRLKDNLRLGKHDASDEELWAVLAQVGLDGWAKAQPDGLLTLLGEYGSKVSGGQARRIALARLLLSPKKVLLLDEPFAGLDDETRIQLWQRLVCHQADGLLVVVTHHSDIISQDGVDTLAIGEPVPF